MLWPSLTFTVQMESQILTIIKTLKLSKQAENELQLP